MAILRFKRSAVSGKIPTVNDLQLGEVAINTFDGKVYLKKDNGTQSIVEVGAATGSVSSVSGTGNVNGITLSGTVTSSGSLTLGGTLSNVSLTTQVSGILPLANGGTGASTAANARTALGVPSTTGSGASGSWGISITGSADQLGGYVRDRFVYGDNTTGSINSFVTDGGVGANNLTRSCFYRDNNNQFGALGVHVQHPSNTGYALQLASPNYTGSPLQYRQKSAGTWGSVITLLDSTNYNTYSPTLTGTGASGTWGISITGSAATLTTARTITIGNTGKTFNGSGNVAWSLSEIGASATSHKYHSFASGQYFYDNYEQGNYFRLFTENATYSTTRYRTISNVEYWDFGTSAWVAWTGGEAGIRNLLDGRQDTSMAVAHANRRFRFVVSQSSGWPTLVLYYLQSTWSAITYTSATVTLETSTTVNGTYTTRDTAVFGSATTGNNYGMHVRTTSALHTGDAFLRVTIDITDWVDSGGYTTYPLLNFEVLSNFSGSALEPFSWDYYRNLTVPGSLTATTLNGSISSSQVTTALGFTPYNATNPNGYTSNTGTVTSVALSGGTTGLTATGGPITTSGTITLGGTLAVANGGTGASTAAGARTNLGATTVGGNIFTLTNPSAIRFLRLNADNTVSALDAASFRTAIGAGTGNGNGTVTSVSGTGTVNGITLTGSVTSSGSLTLGGTLSGINLTTQVTGVLPVANGGTGASSLTANNVILGNGTSAVQTVAPGTSGNVLTSNGTTWVSQAPSGGGSTAVSYPQNVQSGNYTLVLTDAGKHIYSANTAAQTITIPTEASVAFPIGTLITIVNMGTYAIKLSASGVSVLPNGSTTPLSTATVASGQNVQLVKTGTNTWTCTFGSLSNVPFSYLIVAGGGAGGGNTFGCGGGGGGGMLTGASTAPNGTLTITVGAGGASTSAQGSNSSISGVATAIGGGGGGNTTGIYINGGSGGGCNQSYNGGTLRGGSGIYGQGNNGGGSNNSIYAGGGGGGAGAPGNNVVGYSGANGGNGLASSITGSSVTYAGGGGGGVSGGAGGSGGSGGGGASGISGTANTGGGGGGTGDYTLGGASGGSGVVIIRTPIAATSTTGSPTVTTSGADTIYKFTSSGTITW